MLVLKEGKIGIIYDLLHTNSFITRNKNNFCGIYFL